MLAHASVLSFGLLKVLLSRPGDKNVLPAIHVHLLFISFLIEHKSAIELLQHDIPWERIVAFLNPLLRTPGINRRLMLDERFPIPPVRSRRPLCEDFLIRGQRYAKGYFPDNWFEDSPVDEEERPLELLSTTALRTERILWLGKRIADHSALIVFDHDENEFKVSDLAKGFEPREITKIFVTHPVPSERSSTSTCTGNEETRPPSRGPSPQTSNASAYDMESLIKKCEARLPFIVRLARPRKSQRYEDILMRCGLVVGLMLWLWFQFSSQTKDARVVIAQPQGGI